tara:strand:+ start:1922 stop:2164 length:243 start_codon:yes stop_codon:yes gene_type:complete
MNTKISKDWFANVLSRFVAFEMDEEEQQKFIETLIQDWMYSNKHFDLRWMAKHLNHPDFGEPINKLENDTFWEKELNTIK